MRLLHVHDLRLKEFIGRNVPRYAIVSHRWSDEEISYQYFQDQRQEFINGSNGHCEGYGWTKIAKACEIAKQRGLDWVWLDTTCINKESSAELSEAINSMYNWYRGSAECYVFLPDVYEGSLPGLLGLDLRRVLQLEQHAEYIVRSSGVVWRKSDVKASTWFARAWTLQELLAPQHDTFYSSTFVEMGSRATLSHLINDATGIPDEYLAGLFRTPVSVASVAERMKWASKRRATREEDIAYSLLGVFNVNMPLLYGEGARSFLRLQTEITRMSDDESIFAWESVPGQSHPGILAPHVSSFTKSITGYHRFSRSHYEVTNKGVRITVRLDRQRLLAKLQTYQDKSGVITLLMPLNCEYSDRLTPAKRWDANSVPFLHVTVNVDQRLTGSTPLQVEQLRFLLGHRVDLQILPLTDVSGSGIGLISDLDTNNVEIPIYFPIAWDRD